MTQTQLTPAQEQYQQRVEQWRHSRYMDWPSHVHLETFAKCNASCCFCPYPTLDRKGERMPDALIEKVLGDLEDMPADLPFQLSPYKVNEPFLDVRIFDLLDQIRTRLPRAAILLTTNASPLTGKLLRRLIQHPVDRLWISFNDHRKAHYESIMGIPFLRTLESLDRIHAVKASGELGAEIVLSRVSDASPADREFTRWVANRYPLFKTAVFPRGEWLGQTAGTDPTEIHSAVPAIGCTRWFELSITATGDVAHCCMDGKLEYPIGNVRDQHVLEVYNAPEYRRLRESTRTRLDATPCNRCHFM